MQLPRRKTSSKESLPPASRAFSAAQSCCAAACHPPQVQSFGKDHPYTRLVPDLSGGDDPDDAFSRIPYGEGQYLSLGMLWPGSVLT